MSQDLKEFQDILDIKGIVKKQLDLSDYSDCTKEELKYIVENEEKFANRFSFEDKLEMLRHFVHIKRPDDIDDSLFIKRLAAHPFAKAIDISKWGFSYPNGYLALYKVFQEIEINALGSIILFTRHEFDRLTNGTQVNGRSKFDEERQSGSDMFKAFAGLAEITISRSYMDNRVFRDLLFKSYMRNFDE